MTLEVKPESSRVPLVTPLSGKPGMNRNLRTIVERLEAAGPGIDADHVREILERNELSLNDVAEFVTRNPDTYARRRVARTEAFELLVMTWLPGQGSGPHDHAGSVSAFKILQGTAHETCYEQAADSLVDVTDTRQLHAGDAGLDPSGLIHAVRNEQPAEVLVSVHVYAPPIRELRRFNLRAEGAVPPDALRRRPSSGTPVVAIVGGGCSGALVAVQLLRSATTSGTPLHLVILDRQTAIAEGAAYRTPDLRHLLNVPASGMSAWPDRPDDFLEWMRRAGSSVPPHTFIPRRTYGEYLRATFLDAIAKAGPQVSVEIRRQEADTLERGRSRGWRVQCTESRAIEADVVVLATGHAPPVDPLKRRWAGSRARYIEDPWSSLTLTAIEKDESVCLLGTGLTAIDVLQSLGGSTRCAPVMAFSRHGLLPEAHRSAPLPPIDPRDWLEPLLRAGTLATRTLSRRIRRAIQVAESAGRDWRQVIDGLRAHTPEIWKSLHPRERSRFLRHARAFWEVHRHRMAPTVAREVQQALGAGIYEIAGARVLGAHGDLDGATLTVQRRGASVRETLRFDWVVNCTGPGTWRDCGFPSIVSGLIRLGYLEDDPLGLGTRSAADGQALAGGRIMEDLFLIGTLRKAEVWESTAVPELRRQAELAAHAIVARINTLHREPAAEPMTAAVETRSTL